MITAEKKFRKIVPEELRNLPVVEYPEEEIVELREILRETLEEFNSGKLVPQTAEEFASAHGIVLDAEEDEPDGV